MTRGSRETVSLPRISRVQLRWFAKYVRYYVRKNFHSVYCLRLEPLNRLQGWPLLVCLNHPSWWDPLLALFLSQRFFENRVHYAPIASDGLAKYRFFERLGFFGISPGIPAGAARFREIGEAVLKQSNGAFWVTPQAHFADVRQRPVAFASGVGHLAHRVERFAMLPIALEYTFWNERFPEAFACFGSPVFVERGLDQSPAAWTIRFAESLAATQDVLTKRVLLRDPALFEPLLCGAAGIGGVYDRWRSLKARWEGRKFQPEHGSR